MRDHWPWEAKELNPQELFNKTTFPSLRESIWLLQISIIGNYYISHPKDQFSTQIGDLICLGQKFNNDATQESQWWGAPNHTEPQPHLLATIAWNHLNLSNRYLQTADEKKVIKEITDKIKKLAYVPVQT
jgi:NRPS condensation-like uncharacterized protein